MPVRASMANLITRTRRYLGDPSGASQHFADQDVQDSLDEHRYQVTDALLRPNPQVFTGGVLIYNRYEADQGDWEDPETPDTPMGLKLKWFDYSIITPATADPIAAVWTFSDPYPGKVPTVRITGKFYDLWAAVEDLALAWAAALSLQFDATADGQIALRSQQSAMLRDVAANAAAKKMPRRIKMERGDIEQEQGAQGLTYSTTEGW